MRKQLSVFICISVFLVTSAFAQFADLNTYVTRTWSSLDGLPGNSVTDIIQAKDGYMYFGTYEGLVRFDGYDFAVMNRYSDEKLAFISARTIFEDSSGAMWIGSNDEGIQKLMKEGNQFSSEISENKIYTIADGISNNSIRTITEDKFNNIWVGTAAGVFYITPDGKIEKPKTNDDTNIDHILVKQLYCDTAGKIWLLGNGNKTIYVYSGETFTRYEDLDVYGDYIATAISQDKLGNYWLGLSGVGVVEIGKTGNIRKFYTETILDTALIQTIYCDKNGAIWFGTENGLVFANGGDFIEYNEGNGIDKSSVQKIGGDREGDIWIATSTIGIGKISPGKFSTTIIDHAVNAICEDSDSDVWVGADDGLHFYTDDQEEENEMTDFCKNVRVRHIEMISDGDLLICCYAKPALVICTEDGITSWTKDDGLAGNRTRVAIETSDGNIYCGTTTGLSILHEDGTIKNFTVSTGFDCEYIMSLYEDNDGFVWVGTDGGGIYILKDEEIVYTLTTEEGLAGNVVFKIRQDNIGNYWVCTGSGISKFQKSINFFVKNEPKNIVNYTSAEGLGSDSIFQIIDDDNGNYWMISNRGISSASVADFSAVENGTKKTMDCKFYNQNDGLKSTGANSTALSMKDKHGRIWFTMADGFSIYDPVRAKANTVLPIIQLQEIRLDDMTYYTFDEPIVIPPGNKHIDIKYTGMSYTASERNRFTHQLVGFDDGYTDFSPNRIVSYTNLKAGKYSFSVNMINGEGLAAPEPCTVELIQQAYFYTRPVFWIGVGVLILLIVTLIFFIEIRRAKAKQLILETKIQMAIVDLQIARDESEGLLRSILPDKIAAQLKGIKPEGYTIAKRFDNVTVLFSDIVGFTNTTSNHTAEEIVSSLNDLVSRFDVQAKKMHIEKIKTIGDAYMAVCGAPDENPKHAEIMLKFATVMYKELQEYNKTAKIQFKLRIGINSGSVIAGVIGKDKFIYDIWGDTVNVANRMESNCAPMHIRMTENVVQALEAHGYHYDYKIEEVDVKGKGLMKTYELPKN